ncbi:MAG: flagellar motor switch protein FliM [Syntrophotaleaceae bacterium]
MERILSKEEIAELLSAVQDGDIDVDPVESGGPYGEKQVRQLDLLFAQSSRQCKFDNLDIIMDSFGRNYGISLTNCLQSSVTVKRTAIETYEFDNFLQRLGEREAIGLIRLDPLRWGGLFIMSGELAFFIMENLLGGKVEQKRPAPNRPLTTIERHVLKGVFDDACLDLEKAFLPLEKLNSLLVKIENNPRLVNIVPADTLVIVCRFKVTLRKLEGQLTLVLPLPSLEPLRDKMREQMAPMAKKSFSAWRETIGEEVVEMEAEVVAQLAEIALPVRDILNFQVGDIIDLGRDPSAPLTLLVEGRPKYLVQAGVTKGNKAVRVLKRAEEIKQAESKRK